MAPLDYGHDKELQRKDQEKGDQPRNPDPWKEPEQLDVKPPKVVPKQGEKPEEKRSA